ncbi:hypothetical protein ACHAWF_005673 [Thalassiosira exigua]
MTTMLAPPCCSGRPPSSRQYTFVLSGQSNMVGRAGLQQSVDAETDSRSWIWNDVSETYAEEMNLTGSAGSMDGRIRSLTADLLWEDGGARLHDGMDSKTVGIGPGLFLARDFLQKLDDAHGEGSTVRLIPTAKGASSLEDWWPDNTDTGFYANMIDRIRASNATDIDAFVWYQGESDALDKDAAESYAERLQQWIGILRSDLGFLNSCWAVLVKPVGIVDRLPFISTVREQVEAAAANTTFATVVDAPIDPYESEFDVDTPHAPPGLRSDRVHLNLPAQVIMGQSISNVVLDLPGMREPDSPPTTAPSGAGPADAGKSNVAKSGGSIASVSSYLNFMLIAMYSTIVIYSGGLVVGYFQ